MTEKDVDALLDSLKEELEPTRDLVLKLAKSGEINMSEAKIKKANESTLKKVLDDYNKAKLQVATQCLSEKVVQVYSKTLGFLKLVEGPDDLMQDLLADELFMGELNSIVGCVAPYIPLVGLVSGAITTSAHLCYYRKLNESAK